jgi:hypothetical protein
VHSNLITSRFFFFFFCFCFFCFRCCGIPPRNARVRESIEGSFHYFGTQPVRTNDITSRSFFPRLRHHTQCNTGDKLLSRARARATGELGISLRPFRRRADRPPALEPQALLSDIYPRAQFSSDIRRDRSAAMRLTKLNSLVAGDLAQIAGRQ